MGTAIGTVDMSEEDLRQNIVKSINFLASLTKKGWQNIKSVHLHVSMDKNSYRIYG